MIRVDSQVIRFISVLENPVFHTTNEKINQILIAESFHWFNKLSKLQYSLASHV